MPRLTKQFVATAGPGKYADDRRDGLVLLVKPSGARSWVQRITVKGRRREIGLGSCRYVSLEEARDAAYENRRRVQRDGGDPLADKRKAEVPTFAEAVEAVIALHSPNWKDPRGVTSFRSHIATHASRLAPMRVDAITSNDIMGVVSPIWSSKRSTARAVMGRIATVMRWVLAQGHRPDDPLVAVKAALPANGAPAAHHRALSHAEVPEALDKLKAGPGWPVTTLAIEFVCLTAARSGEGRLATWDEIDLDARTWTISGVRMKMNREHRIPLSDGAMRVLEAAAEYRDGDLVFPAAKGGPINDRLLRRALAKVGINATIHGFRSSFRDWCAETNQDRQLAEAALAHVVGGVEAAYLRSDLFERRRVLMQAWSDYLAGKRGAKVVPLRA